MTSQISSSSRTSSRTSSRSNSPSLLAPEAFLSAGTDPKQFKIASFSVNHTLSHVCLACGDAFRCYSLPQFKLVNVYHVARVTLVEQMGDSGLFAFVTALDPCTVSFWDVSRGSVLSPLRIGAPVTDLRLTDELLVVATNNKLFIYNSADNFRPIACELTRWNPDASCALALCPRYIVAQGCSEKSVCIYAWAPDEKKIQIFRNMSNIHPKHNVHCLAVSPTGTYFATVSTNGQNISVIEIATGKVVKTCCRGKKTAKIFSLAFNANERFIACISNRGTCHVFDLKEEKPKMPIAFLNVNRAQDSIAKIRGLGDSPAKAWFDPIDPNLLFILSKKGDITKVEIDPAGPSAVETSSIFDSVPSSPSPDSFL